MTHPKRKSSGEHEAVRAFRKKIDSIAENTIPQLEALNARIDRLKSRSDPPNSEKKDPRRDTPTDPRVEDELAVDVVDLDDLEADTKPQGRKIVPPKPKE